MSYVSDKVGLGEAAAIIAPVATFGTASAAGATGIPQYYEQKSANREARRIEQQAQAEREKANRISQAGAQVENARRRRQAIAQARVAQARNAASVGSAVQTSSALSGTQSGISSQLGANIGAQSQRIGTQSALNQSALTIADLGRQRNQALREGQERIQAWNAAADTGKLVLNAFGGGGIPGAGGGSVPNSFASQTPGPRGAGGFR